MTDPSTTIRLEETRDLDRVESLLGGADLPTRDVGESPARFYLAYAGEDCVGCGGLEVHGAAGLLRSVAVADPHRERGYGTAIVASLEERARAADVAELSLLTTTAAGFFRDLGYQAVPRDAVPAAIRETAEFAELCPSSATCMRKRLR